jgi:hypothetical protein
MVANLRRAGTETISRLFGKWGINCPVRRPYRFCHSDNLI